MPLIQLEPDRSWSSAVRHVVWRSVQVAAGTLVVVVPFGYAITPVHDSVMMAAGAGFAVGVGLSLRMGDRGGRAAGVLIGSVVGIVIAFLAGLLPQGLGFLFVIGPSLPFTVGLCDGLGAARTRGYRDAAVESLTVAALLGLGLFPAPVRWGAMVMALACVPTTVLVAGFFSHDRHGRRYVRPPLLLIVAVLAEMGAAAGIGMLEGTNLETTLVMMPTMLLVVPGAAFLSARAAAAWLRPRLRVYLQLADYLRVMWIPIGGFTAGYLAIILVFAGFCGMLERFGPGSFAGAANAGIGDWIAFSFFSALAQDYTGITPVSAAAGMLVGARLVISVGWALVVFAAVMSAIQPQLERIARRNASTDAD
ncbi:MAG: hypothetical protein F4137_24360 [Acidobacteria bacterium]|nr:hypothetical protein [Acidobacteriota bacterium]